MLYKYVRRCYLMNVSLRYDNCIYVYVCLVHVFRMPADGSELIFLRISVRYDVDGAYYDYGDDYCCCYYYPLRVQSMP